MQRCSFKRVRVGRVSPEEGMSSQGIEVNPKEGGVGKGISKFKKAFKSNTRGRMMPRIFRGEHSFLQEETMKRRKQAAVIVFVVVVVVLSIIAGPTFAADKPNIV